MITMQEVREVLGWCAVLNMGLLLIAALGLSVMGRPIRRIHAELFSLSEDDLSRAYFQYLAQYKIAVVVFNVVPYLALYIVE